MKFSVIALMLLGAVACQLAAARLETNSLAWRQFKQQHGKVYATQEEDARRFAIFMANKQLVDSHNADNSASFTMGLNHMSDLTAEEKGFYNGFNMVAPPSAADLDEEVAEIIGQGPAPDELDWRKVKGRVARVKDQGGCQASWAFTATGLLEGQELPQNMSSLVELSEQMILDCAHGLGCVGGNTWQAIDDLVVSKLGGIESELDYPYMEDFQQCMAKKSKFVPLKIKGHSIVPQGFQSLKQAVANYGPVAVALNATKLHTYSGGIFEDNICTEKPNHGALLVGYGKDAQKGDFWIAKNSWGDKWGENGYFRIKAGTNMCGIENFGIIATFD